MQELLTRANLVDFGALDEHAPIAVVLERRALEAARDDGETAELWLELGSEGEEDTWRVSVDLETADIDEILRRSTDDEIALAFDADALTVLTQDSDVEAHGLRHVLGIAVVSAAILAPTSMAASPMTSQPQAMNPAKKMKSVNPAAQVKSLSPAKRAKSVSPAAEVQSLSPAKRAKSVSPAKRAKSLSPAKKAKSASSVADAVQISNSLVLKASGLTAAKYKLVR